MSKNKKMDIKELTCTGWKKEEKTSFLTKHLVYEYRMMLFARSCLLKKSDPHSIQYMSSLESFLLHFRCLYYFFFYEAQYKTDVVAKCFVDGWSSKAPDKLSNIKLDVDRRLAHLTTDRVADKGWTLPQLIKMNGAMVEAVNKFTELFESSELKQAVREEEEAFPSRPIDGFETITTTGKVKIKPRQL